MIVTLARRADLALLLAFRKEAAAWLAEKGTDQWNRPYPADRLLASIEAGHVFMVRDGSTTPASVTLSPEAEGGLWTASELAEPSIYVSKLTVSRSYGGRNLGGRLLTWAGDRAHRAGARWLRLDAWTTNEPLHRYYEQQGFTHVRTVLDGGAVNGGPRVSGWLAQRRACPGEHGFAERALPSAAI